MTEKQKTGNGAQRSDAPYLGETLIWELSIVRLSAEEAATLRFL